MAIRKITTGVLTTVEWKMTPVQVSDTAIDHTLRPQLVILRTCYGFVILAIPLGVYKFPDRDSCGTSSKVHVFYVPLVWFKS